MVRSFLAGIFSFHPEFPVQTQSGNEDPPLVPANLLSQLQHEHEFVSHCVLQVEKQTINNN
jgi:hypothetical protein